MTFSRLKKYMSAGTLSPAMVDRILAKLGFSEWPEPSVHALQALYHAWCRKVPFDNILWRIYLKSDREGPLPSHSPERFFENWLNFGTGGICFPAATSLYALLKTLGFNVIPVLSWIPDALHSMVVVEIEGIHYLVDQSVPHSDIIPLDEASKDGTSPGWGMRVFFETGRWHFRWKAFRLPGVEEIGCAWQPKQYLEPQVKHTLAETAKTYVQCEQWSKYNYNLNATLFRGDVLMRIVEGKREVLIDADTHVLKRDLDKDELMAVLIEGFGISEEIVRQLPACEPSVDRRQAMGERRQSVNGSPSPDNERRHSSVDRRRLEP